MGELSDSSTAKDGSSIPHAFGNGDREDSAIGDSESGKIASSVYSPHDSDDSVLFWTFPWIALSVSDNTVLSDHISLLTKGDDRDAEEVCQALEEVLLQDFPAEVFLQRPSILRTLFTILDRGNDPLVPHAFRVISFLTTELAERFYEVSKSGHIQEEFLQHGDGDCSLSLRNRTSFAPSTFQISKSQKNGTEEQQANAVSNDTAASTDDLESIANSLELAQRQIPLPVFVCAVMDACLNAISEQDFQPSSGLGCSDLIILLEFTARLLIQLLRPSIWTSQALQSKRMASHLSHSLSLLGSRILFHHQQTEQPVAQSSMSRIIHMGLVKCATVLTELIPVECVSSIPETLCESITIICTDEPLQMSYPMIRQVFLPYLQIISQQAFSLSMQAQKVCTAMDFCVKFVHSANSQETEASSRLSWAEMALRSLPSLVFHESVAFIKECWLLCSKALCTFPDNHKAFIRLIQRLLAYQNTTVQKKTYGLLLDFCHRVLNTGNATTNGEKKPAVEVVFLTYPQVLKEITLYGLVQEETQLFAQAILALMSQKSLLNSEPVWDCLTINLKALFCGIFAHADLGTDFGRKIVSWSYPDQAERSALFDTVTRNRAAYCMMFHTNRLIRGHAVELLSRRLKGLKINGDSLIAENQHILMEEEAVEGLQEALLERSLKVWADTRLDPVVRWTALRQISSQLFVPEAHLAFSKLQGARSLISMLRLIVEGTERDWNPDNLLLLMNCVCKVLAFNDNQRSEWSMDTTVCDLLLTALQSVPSSDPIWPKMQPIAATCIFLMTFHEMLIRKEGMLSICCTFYRLVLFPCNVLFHDFDRGGSAPVTTELLSTPVGDTIIVHWNVLVAGGVGNILSSAAEKSQQNWDSGIDFAPRLILNEKAKAMIRISHYASGFTAMCNLLGNAQNHSDAIRSLDLMSIYPLLWKMCEPKDTSQIQACFERALRFITILPHSTDDMKLLTAIERFASVLVRFSSSETVLLSWMTGLLANERSILMDAFQKAVNSAVLVDVGSAAKRISYTVSCRELVKATWTLLSSVPKVLKKEDLDVLDVLGIQLEILQSCFKMSAPDIGDIGYVLRSICSFSSIPNLSSLPETIAFIPVLIAFLEKIATDNQHSSTSFWRSGIFLNIAQSLLNFAAGQSRCQLFPSVLESWKNAKGSFDWMLPLWSHRNPLVSACGINIAHILLSNSSEGRQRIMETFENVPGGFWVALINAFTSNVESSMVRSASINLMASAVNVELEAAGSEGQTRLNNLLEKMEFYDHVARICDSFCEGRHAGYVEEYVVGSLFRLCANLVKGLGVKALEKMKTTKFIHAALHSCFLVKSFVQPSNVLMERMRMYSDLFGLLVTCLRTDESFWEIIFHNMHCVGAAFCLLNPAIGASSALKSLWINIYIFLSEALANGQVREAAWRSLSDHYQLLQDSVRASLQLPSISSSAATSTSSPDNVVLQNALLCFVESLFLTSDSTSIAAVLWTSDSPENPSVGQLVLQFLIRKFDVVSSSSPSDPYSSAELLKRLLTHHDSAKKIAMDYGLLDAVIDRLLDIDSTISKDLHVHSRNVLKKRMSEPIRLSLELLMCLFYRNSEAKKRASSPKLISALISLWITIISEVDNLHLLFLRLLCTYGAACQESLSMFVRESEHSGTASLTLFHVILADLQDQLQLPMPHPDITPVLFDLLKQMSISPQCRPYMRKSLSVKRAMPKPSPRKPKFLQMIDALWLRVLSSLSFFEDGQIVILSREDICMVLLEYLETEGLADEVYAAAMLILRNLAFSKKGLVRLAGAKGMLAKLVKLSSFHHEPKVRLYAVSCLLEILYDQVKLRHAAKALSFDEFRVGRPDDEPEMFELRARLLAFLDEGGTLDELGEET